MEVAKIAVVTLGLNYGVHHVSSMAHHYFCIPHSIGDLLQSLVTTASPACSVLVHVMQITQNNYGNVLMTSVASAVAGALKA